MSDGLFDDLVPGEKPAPTGKASSGGMFDDLMPSTRAAKPRDTTFDNVLGHVDTVGAPKPKPHEDVSLLGVLARGGASAIASAGHAASDFIDQTIQQPLRGVLQPLGIMPDGDPLGAQSVAHSTLGVEREINAERQAEGQHAVTRSDALRALNPHTDATLGDRAGALGGYGEHLVRSGVESLPAMALALATRNPEIAAGILGGTTGAQEYTDLRTQGVDRGTATLAGAGQGAMEVVGEGFGLPFVMDRLGQNSLRKALGAEFGQEFVTQLGQQNLEDAATGNETPVGQQLGDALDAGLVGAGMGGGGHVALNLPAAILGLAKRAPAPAPAPAQAPLGESVNPAPAPTTAVNPNAIDPAILAAGNAALTPAPAAAPAAPETPAPAPVLGDAAAAPAPTDDLDALLAQLPPDVLNAAASVLGSPEPAQPAAATARPQGAPAAQTSPVPAETPPTPTPAEPAGQSTFAQQVAATMRQRAMEQAARATPTTAPTTASAVQPSVPVPAPSERAATFAPPADVSRGAREDAAHTSDPLAELSRAQQALSAERAKPKGQQDKSRLSALNADVERAQAALAAPAPTVAPAPTPEPGATTGALYQRGNGKNNSSAQALRLPDGSWRVRHRKGGQWQAWEHRATFDPSPAFGYRETGMAGGAVHIEGAGRVPVRKLEAEKREADYNPLLDLIAKSGGISREDAARFGVDPKMMNQRRGIRPLFGKQGIPLDGLLERMQEAGYLPATDPDAPPVYDLNDAWELVSKALGGETVAPLDDAKAMALAEQRNASQYGPEETEADTAPDDEAATFFDEVEREAGEHVAPGDEAEAKSLADLYRDLAAAGVALDEVLPEADEADGAYAARLWARLKEAQRGANTQAESGDRAPVLSGREGGQAEPVRGFQLEAAAAPAEAPRQVAPQGGLFAPPTRGEQVRAASESKDASRNGLGRDLVRPEQGDGELLAGAKPAQAEVPADDGVSALVEAANAARARSRAASAAMDAFPKGAMGLTPDAVKASPEWIAARAEMSRALAAERNANVAVVKARKAASKPAPDAAPDEARELTENDLTPEERAVKDKASNSAAAREKAANLSRAQGEADALSRGFPEAIERVLGDQASRVEYVRDYAGLPDSLRDGVESRNAERAGKVVTAAIYDPASQRVFIVTSVVKTADRAVWNALHEIAGHDGLRKLLGPKLDAALNIALQNPTVSALADAIMRDRNMDKGQRTLAAEEALAELAAAVRTGDYSHIASRYGVEVGEGMRASVQASIANFLKRLKALLDDLFGRPVFLDEDVRALLDAALEASRGDGKASGDIAEQVSVERARGLKIGTQLPNDETFAAAVANTPGAEITPQGLELDLVRFQKPEQVGDTSVRTGVFYLPAGASQAKHYRNGKDYGGSVKVEGRTLIKRPLLAKGGTGGKAPEAAYDSLKGKGAYQKMRDAILHGISLRFGQSRMDAAPQVEAVLAQFGADPGIAYELVLHSARGNTLSYALQENIVAHAVRDAGYDAVVGWSKGKTGPFISEVFDVREVTNPDHSGETELHDKFIESTDADPTQTPAFRKWFGDSKVVDADGKPLVVYHGTTNADRIVDAGFKPGWVHLTDSKPVADSYQEWERGGQAGTLAVYVNAENPAYFDAKGQKYTDIGNKVFRATADAERAGHDALIIQNVRDNYDSSVDTDPHTTFVVFKPEQIKSATANNGNFDAGNPSILENVEPVDFAQATGRSVIADGRLLSFIDAAKAAGADTSALRDALANTDPAARAKALIAAIDELLPKVQPAPRERAVTGTKNAVTEAERLAEGRDPILREAAKSNADTLAEALRTLKEDPSIGDIVVEKLVRGGVDGVSLADEAILLVHKTTLRNRRDSAAKVLADPDASDERKTVARREWESLEAQIATMDEATRASGREWGRMGQFRQRMLRDDYTFAALERKERARLERPLTVDESAKIKVMADTIAERQARADKLQARVANAESEGAYESLVQRMARPPKQRRSVEYLRKAANDARARLASAQGVPSRRGQSGAVISPLTFADLAVIGAYHIANGAAKFADWVGAMRADIGERFDAFKREHPNIFKAAQQELEKPIRAEATVAEVLDAIDLANLKPKDVRKLIAAYVGEGMRGEPAVIAAAAKALELDEGEVRQLFVQSEGRAKPTLTEAQEELRDLRAIVRLENELERLKAGTPSPARTESTPDSPAVAAKRAEVAALKAKMAQAGRDAKTAAAKEADRLNTIDGLKLHAEELQRQIDMGYRRIPADKPTPAPVDSDMQAARDALAAVKAKVRDLDRINALQNEIERLEAGKPKPARAPAAPDSPAVAAKKQELAEVRARLKPTRDPEGRYQEMRGKQIAKRIEELQQRIAAGDFAPRPRVPRALNEANQRAQFELEKAKHDFVRHQFEAELAARSPLGKVFGAIGDTFNLARAMMTSFDMSGLLRQGGFITYGHPVRGAKSLGPALRAFASAQAEHDVRTSIENRRNAPLYKRFGLQLTGIGAGPLTQVEEAYASRWLEKFPTLLGGGLVRGSGRAYTALLNTLRADSFDAMVASLARTSTPTEAEGKAIADFINVATGRGKVGKNENIGQALNTVFFAPRLVASRFQLLTGTGALYGGTPRTRKLIQQEYARFILGYAVVTALLTFGLGGDDDDDGDGDVFGTDPRASNFGKIRVGNTYIDGLAGLSQVSVFLARLATGETVTHGKVKPLRPRYTLTDLRRALGSDIPAHKLGKDGGLDYGATSAASVIGGFLRQKLAPVPGAIVNVLTGTNLNGELITPIEAGQELVTPMSFQNVADILEEQGLTKGTTIVMLGLLGDGIQYHADSNAQQFADFNEGIAAVQADVKDRLAALPVDQWPDALAAMKKQYGPVMDGVELQVYKTDGKYGHAGEPRRDADGKPVLTSNRISDGSAYRKNAQAGDGEQTHHLIPDNLVRHHPLMVQARRMGYDLDRSSNLVNLPAKAADGQIAHNTSHPEYDAEVFGALQAAEKQLKKDYGSLKDAPAGAVLEAVRKIEAQMRARIQKRDVPTKAGRLAALDTELEDVG